MAAICLGDLYSSGSSYLPKSIRLTSKDRCAKGVWDVDTNKDIKSNFRYQRGLLNLKVVVAYEMAI